EYTEPVPLGVYLNVKALFYGLKKEREAAGLSLVDMEKRTGMDKAALSRLENGRQPNPTIDTLLRYAAALGKQIVLAFADLSGKGQEECSPNELTSRPSAPGESREDLFSYLSQDGLDWVAVLR